MQGAGGKPYSDPPPPITVEKTFLSICWSPETCATTVIAQNQVSAKCVLDIGMMSQPLKTAVFLYIYVARNLFSCP